MEALPAAPTGSWTDPNAALTELIVPYAAYFVGVLVRRYGILGGTTPLRSLLLLGIPFSLTMVTPILMASYSILNEGISYRYLVIIGLIMEQGLVVHEAAVKRINDAMQATTPLPATAG